MVGEADGEGDESTDGLTDAVGLPSEIGVGAGVCASALMAGKRPIKTHNVNGYIETRCRSYNAFCNCEKIRNPDTEIRNNGKQKH